MILKKSLPLKALTLHLLLVNKQSSCISIHKWLLTILYHTAHHGIYQTTKEPYICYGFKFDGVSYISDTNFIPPETMDIIQGKSRVFVVDCLRCKLGTLLE